MCVDYKKFLCKKCNKFLSEFNGGYLFKCFCNKKIIKIDYSICANCKKL